VWRGDRVQRRTATPENSRFQAFFAALAATGVEAVPTVYADDLVDEVRAQLLTVDGVLVWVNPIQDGQNRRTLDALLRDVAGRGVWVSAHPDASSIYRPSSIASSPTTTSSQSHQSRCLSLRSKHRVSQLPPAL
jgi:hypothetical protein